MRHLLAAMGVSGFAALAGCSGRPSLLEPLAGTSGPRLTAGDFRGAGAPSTLSVVGAQTPSTTPTPTRGAGVPPLPTAAVSPPASVTPTIAVVPGAPDLSGAAPPPVEPAALLDEKVGDINGRPIYASEFFEPLEAQMIATSREFRRAEWITGMRDVIARQLEGRINDELLRAEALESLPTQAREAGLSRFLESRRASLQSEAGGSLTEAQKRLLDERGITVEQWLQELEDNQLIRMSVQSLAQDVQISARDIQQYYDRHHDEFNPPPAARMLEIVVGSGNESAKQQISSALAGGTPFADLAAGPLNNSTFRGEGGVHTILLEGSYTQTNLYNIEALNQAAWGLQPGEWAGPIVFGNNGALTMWIYLDAITGGGRSLYEVQTEIIERLRREALVARHGEMVARLRERASFTNESEMVRRLLDIAVARYYPPSQAEPDVSPAPSRPTNPARPSPRP